MATNAKMKVHLKMRVTLKTDEAEPKNVHYCSTMTSGPMSFSSVLILLCYGTAVVYF